MGCLRGMWGTKQFGTNLLPPHVTLGVYTPTRYFATARSHTPIISSRCNCVSQATTNKHLHKQVKCFINQQHLHQSSALYRTVCRNCTHLRCRCSILKLHPPLPKNISTFISKCGCQPIS